MIFNFTIFERNYIRTIFDNTVSSNLIDRFQIFSRKESKNVLFGSLIYTVLFYSSSNMGFTFAIFHFKILLVDRTDIS